MKEIIQKAVKGGYQIKNKETGYLEDIHDFGISYRNIHGEDSFLDNEVLLLDPTFWQSLGKSLGWEKKMVVRRGTVIGNFMCENKGIRFYGEEMGCGMDYLNPWVYYWHRFIDHIAEGKSAESFFESLITNK